MEAIKGLARRATQSVKERFASADSTTNERVEQVAKQIHAMEKAGVNISDKVLRIMRLFEEIGVQLREVGEEYKPIVPEGGPMKALAEECLAMGNEIAVKAQELQKMAKTTGFDPVSLFLKDLPKLKEAQDEQKSKQLEFDFFRHKVADLKRTNQKDPTRVPRNESILENWRKDLWASTEKTKAVASGLYSQGTKAIDQCVLTACQTMTTITTYTAALSKVHIANAAAPVYPTAPVLPPTPLPPSPFQSSPAPVYGAIPSSQPSSLGFGYDQQQQQYPQGSFAQSPPAQQWQAAIGQPSNPPQQQWAPQQDQQQQQQWAPAQQQQPQQQQQFAPQDQPQQQYVQPQQWAPQDQQQQQQQWAPQDQQQQQYVQPAAQQQPPQQQWSQQQPPQQQQYAPQDSSPQQQQQYVQQQPSLQGQFAQQQPAWAPQGQGPQ